MNQDSAGSESEHANHSDISVENEAERIDEKKEKHSVSPEQAENEMKKGELDECEEEIVATIGMRQEYFPDWLEIVQLEQEKTGVAIEDILETPTKQLETDERVPKDEVLVEEEEIEAKERPPVIREIHVLDHFD